MTAAAHKHDGSPAPANAKFHRTSLLRPNAKAAGYNFGAVGQFVYLQNCVRGNKWYKDQNAAAVWCTMRWMRVSSSKNVSGIPMITGAFEGTMLPTCARKI
jgi:hypothetical protein